MFSSLSCDGEIERNLVKHEVSPEPEASNGTSGKRRKTKPVDFNSHKPKKINISVVKKLKTKNSGFERTIIENYFLINGKKYTLRTMLTEIGQMGDERKASLFNSQKICKKDLQNSAEQPSQSIVEPSNE